jgi:hypothetical protein
MKSNTNVQGETSLLAGTRLLLALSLFATVACGAEAEPPSGQEPAGDPGITSENSEELRQQSRWLPWRGFNSSDQHDTNTPGLSVIYGVDVFFTNPGRIHALDVWWYEPSRADNYYTNGDPTGVKRLGPSNPGTVAVRRMNCPGGYVVAGYRIATDQAKTKILKFGVVCRNLSDDNDRISLPMAGNEATLFSDTLVCGEFPHGGSTPGYVEYMISQTNMSGMGARCVLPR